MIEGFRVTSRSTPYMPVHTAAPAPAAGGKRARGGGGGGGGGGRSRPPKHARRTAYTTEEDVPKEEDVMEACQRGDAEAVQQLLAKAGCPRPAEALLHAVAWAQHRNTVDVVRVLLSEGWDMTTRAQVPVPAGAGVTNEEAGDVSAAELLQRMQATCASRKLKQIYRLMGAGDVDAGEAAAAAAAAAAGPPRVVREERQRQRQRYVAGPAPPPRKLAAAARSSGLRGRRPSDLLDDEVEVAAGAAAPAAEEPAARRVRSATREVQRLAAAAAAALSDDKESPPPSARLRSKIRASDGAAAAAAGVGRGRPRGRAPKGVNGLPMVWTAAGWDEADEPAAGFPSVTLDARAVGEAAGDADDEAEEEAEEEAAAPPPPDDGACAAALATLRWAMADMCAPVATERMRGAIDVLAARVGVTPEEAD